MAKRIAVIRMAGLYSEVVKVGGVYRRTTSFGPGCRRNRSEVSELKAAEICCLSDWTVCDELKEARESRFPFQTVLGQLMEMK